MSTKKFIMKKALFLFALAAFVSCNNDTPIEDLRASVDAVIVTDQLPLSVFEGNTTPAAKHISADIKVVFGKVTAYNADSTKVFEWIGSYKSSFGLEPRGTVYLYTSSSDTPPTNYYTETVRELYNLGVSYERMLDYHYFYEGDYRWITIYNYNNPDWNFTFEVYPPSGDADLVEEDPLPDSGD
ncbi:hypothetical protein Barb6_01501 [Bacteroidales bacterium Barb6]|nr:hypothetical protein Barb6_01501 [Bacteroidales bacterium Barb6]